MNEKLAEIYSAISDRISRVASKPMSIDGWCEVCEAMSEAFKAAAIARESDVSVLDFYVAGLKQLCRQPKEEDGLNALSTFDDTYEFYSYKEEKVVMAAFAGMMDSLENWAEVLDLENGRKWRNRENTKPWSDENWDDGYYDRPPYYGWVLTNINKLKNHFDPPIGEYATEVNNNPYYEIMFAYQQTRQQWRFRPEFVEILLSRVTENANSPLVEKYIAWGAKSAEEVPSWCLKVKDGSVVKELFEKNLKVRAADAGDLIDQLNANVKAYNADREKRLRDLVDDCFCGAIYQSQPVLKPLRDKLAEITKGLSEHSLSNDDWRWAEYLSESLKLPRYDIYYYFWHDPEQGPDEPGLFFTVADGSKHEFHYDNRQSDWYMDMDNAEYEIEGVMRQGMAIAVESEIPGLVDEWLEIQANWDECRDLSEFTYHCCGDTLKFARSFCHGLAKLSKLLPLLVKKEIAKEWKPASAKEAVEKYDEEEYANYQKRRQVVVDALSKHAKIYAMSKDPFGFVLKKLREETESMKSGVPLCPRDEACWQDVMKYILSYRPGYAEFEAVSSDEEYDFPVDGVNGERYYLYAHKIDTEETESCRLIRDLVGDYIKAGEKLAYESGSHSHLDWMVALATWKQSKMAWWLGNAQASINEMADKMKNAAALLSVDYKNRKPGERTPSVEAVAKATVDCLTSQLDVIQRQGENTNRNVLRAFKEVKQTRKNTVQLLEEQGVNEKLTNHDNEKVYHCRYTGVDLEMLKAAAELVKNGTLNQSGAAETVFKKPCFKGRLRA